MEEDLLVAAHVADAVLDLLVVAGDLLNEKATHVPAPGRVRSRGTPL